VSGRMKLPTLLLVAYATAFFMRSAQRFFMARPILLRAAADMCRLRPSGLSVAVLPRPLLLLCSAAMALLRRSRSASNSAMIVAVFILGMFSVFGF